MRNISALICVLALLCTTHGQHMVKRNSVREFTQKEQNSSSGRYKYINGSTEDSVKVLALLVEFQPDSVSNTTGTGLFGYRIADGFNPSFEDAKEKSWYESDTVYKYDKLPHNGRYFENHLKFLTNYYNKVSNGKLKVGYEVYPKQIKPNDEYPTAYQVRLDMARYSPGKKAKSETDLDFAIRRTTSLLRFVKDAIVTADTSNAAESPFAKLVMDDTGSLWDVDSTGDSTKVFVLIFHAGSNYLTDGGGNSAAANSPSDMSDLFISQDYFDDYYDVENDTVFKGFAKEYNNITGIKIQDDSLNLLISEVMLCAETSNQDSLNFGINGLLVNLLARQLGVPTLHNKSGFSATGKFGIMDYSGYSAGRGFIPPYPSAFVRSFMGWSNPTVLSAGTAPLTAVGVTPEAGDSESDILLVPINDQEYWLIENRQRNLTNSDPFNYDSTDNKKHITNSGFDFELNKLNLDISATSNVIMNSSNYDIGIGGSGCLIWHIDEKIIDARQELDILNSDSTYRAVALEEADGINDIGIYFVNVLNQRVDDYGGSEDIFPHDASHTSGIKNTMNAQSSPSTEANDQGKTYLSISINPTDASSTERYYYPGRGKLERYTVLNYSNRNMTVTVGNESSEISIIRKAPLQLTDQFVELFSYNIAGTIDSPKELVAIDTTGNLFVIDSENNVISDSSQYVLIPATLTATGNNEDTLYISAKVAPPAATPTKLSNSFAIPHKDGTITFWNGGTTPTTTLTTSFNFTTNIVALGDNWAVGTVDGKILWGTGNTITDTVQLTNASEVNGLAHFNSATGLFAAIDEKGMISILNSAGVVSQLQLSLDKSTFQAPFSLVTGNLNGEGPIEIVTTDLKQNLWILSADSTGTSFSEESKASGFAGYFTDTHSGYEAPSNGTSPALTDIDGDGSLDILVPGTNGVYAFNYKAVLLDSWPAILDQGQWYLRKSIASTPLTFCKDDSVMTLFSTQTGDNGTFYISKIDSVAQDLVNKGKKKLYFKNEFGEPDSSLNHTEGFVDTLLTINDSIVIPSNAPGGLLDVRDEEGNRPEGTITTVFSGTKRYSQWPLTIGAPGSITPLIADLDATDTLINVVSINDNGRLYQWALPKSTFSLQKTNSAALWQTFGGDLTRSNSRSALSTSTSSEPKLTDFYSYPNPVKLYEGRSASARFRYTLGSDAELVKLTIYTVSGLKVFESTDLETSSGVNEYNLPDLEEYASALYRCKLEVTFGSEKVHSFWKMVILRGTL